jgi:hypothetical protein
MNFFAKLLMISILMHGCANNAKKELPIQELTELGISNMELSNTEKLVGVNGHNKNFLIYRMKKETNNKSIGIVATHFALSLYNSNKELEFLLPWVSGFSDVELFEFANDEELVIILSRLGLGSKQVEIVEYEIDKKKIKRKIIGEVPCKYGLECDWIRYNEKKVAVFITNQLNKGLDQGAIYEYSLESRQTKLIKENLPWGYDALNRNTQLENISYDTQKNKFKYGQ